MQPFILRDVGLGWERLVKQADQRLSKVAQRKEGQWKQVEVYRGVTVSTDEKGNFWYFSYDPPPTHRGGPFGTIEEVRADIDQLKKSSAGSLTKRAQPPEKEFPTAMPRKPMSDEAKPTVKLEPETYLEHEQQEIENARAIIMQTWKLLTEEASEGDYKEVKALLDAIKALETFVNIEQKVKEPKKAKDAE